MKKTLLITLSIIVSTFSFAQNISKENNLKELKKTQEKYRNFDNKTEREIYDRHFKSLENRIEKGYSKDLFIFDKSYRNLIQKIFSEIKIANNSYQISEPNFFIIKNNGEL